MSKGSKTVKSIYMYLVVVVTLIISAVSLGTIIYSLLSSWAFGNSDTGSYMMCSNPPVVSVAEAQSLAGSEVATVDEKVQIESLIASYDNWKAENENCAANARKRDIIRSVAMIVVALPLLWFHIRLIRKDKKEAEEAQISSN